MRVRGVEYSARAVLKAFWLTVAETPFVALLLPLFVAARPFRRRSAGADYVVCLYATFLFFYLIRLNYLRGFLRRRGG
jgi:hypothetical protein